MSRGSKGSWHQLIRALWRHAPCEGCRNEVLCSSERVACPAFQSWHVRGQRIPESAPREPTRKVYRALFPRDAA